MGKDGPFRVVRLSGGAHDRGFTYGRSCRDLIERLVASHYSFYGRFYDAKRDELLKEARKFIPEIEGYSPEIAEEIRGTAEGAGVQYEEVVMIVSFPEMYYPKLLGACTAFAVSDSVTASGDVYVGQNEDEALDPWLEGECSVLLSIKEKGAPEILTYAYAGIPAMKGMNSEGIALCINAILCEESQVGVPSLVVTREVLRQRSIGDAIGAIIRAKRANSLNYVIGDRSGEIYDVEAIPSGIDHFYSESHLVHSNHIRSDRLGIEKDYILEGLPDTIVRYNRMDKLIRTRHGEIDDGTLISLLRDHVNYPNSICRHAESGVDPAHTMKTLDSILLVPT
ncbi:MAG: C45 family peptidase, partial [Candidatus Bathyarchaeota archaeon]|nr:C45 family peptidase [Candidatus Bathyarchaeota archaeon]